ncbi:MAG: ATP-binding protein [Kiritimatiellia bacterium]
MHATICDCLADVVQNAIEAGATLVEAKLEENDDAVKLWVKDNGKGMDDATLARVWDPFFTEPGKHDRRRVGLGLPLLRQMVEAADGDFSLESESGVGTTLAFSFDAKHLDTPPLGDLPGTLLTLFCYDGDFDLVFSRSLGDQSYEVRRRELQEVLGELAESGNLVLTRDFLRSQETDL